MNRSRIVSQRTQRGVTLVIALLILVMIMMFGVPAAMDSMRNERTAGNTRQRDLAFEAAEHTLKKAGDWILTKTFSQLDSLAPAVKSCNSSPDDADPVSGDGILPNGECHANDVAYWRDTFNWDSYGVNPSGSISLVAAQPRYVVERMPDVTSGSPAVTKHYFRITARAVGQDSNAVVVLQTMYEYSN